LLARGDELGGVIETHARRRLMTTSESGFRHRSASPDGHTACPAVTQLPQRKVAPHTLSNLGEAAADVGLNPTPKASANG